ncbi:GntR family transcriptional regulator [Dinoroseobacter sp. PD6]|uniref:GntR family transcriptional regulator n=1 Tax=Dinoroseobacter sp. PD6 TaxID=3028384 RepID=UPI00237BA8D6|nr:GntR family transcriptional regulator [Dinoroseobacter sp. PD6]MDD9718303.1 GntR family transcriptional regulator [Dinoroseobacter sp. PD6]
MDGGSGTHLPEGGKARRVYLQLRDMLSRGALRPGDTLPGEQKMAAQYGVSRVTIRRALEALADDGLIDKRAGAGSTVREAAQDTPLAGNLASLMPQLVEMGQRTEARLLAFSYGAAPAAVVRALGLAEAVTVQTAVRVRLLRGVPFSHLTTHVPAEIATNYSEADLATTPLFRLLERSGVRIASARQSVTATLATPEVAAALDVSVGSALTALTRIVTDDQGQWVEYLSALYRPDLYRLDMTLSRVGAGEDRHWQPVIGAPPETDP